MDGITWVKWLLEPWEISGYSDGRTRVLYVEKCLSHVEYDNVQECL